MNKNKDELYFPALTGVRALAAYMVYIHHYNNSGNGVFQSFFAELHTGVTLFFVLSGFLIAFRYLAIEKLDFKNYMINRIARIYPMYFILTTLTFLFYAITTTGVDLNIILLYFSNITFMKGFFDDFMFSGIAQGWTLTVEETFYILAPFILFLVKRRLASLLIIPILLLSLGFLIVKIFGHLDFYGFFGSNDFMLIRTFFGRCVEFFAGIGLAVFFKKNKIKPTGNYLTYIGFAVIIICIYILALAANAGNGIEHPFGKVINNLILPLFGVSIFYLGLLTEKTIISKILQSRLCVFIGKSSYVFYLIHIGFLATLLKGFISNSWLLFLILNLVAMLLFKYVEEPLNTLIRKRFLRPQVA